VVDVRAGPNQENEHVDLDFLDPVTVSAQVFDSQGNVLTNVTATSALGVNYLAGGGTTTPEAGTLSMLTVGFLALVAFRFISFREGPHW
jgi:hypothetical protein